MNTSPTVKQTGMIRNAIFLKFDAVKVKDLSLSTILRKWHFGDINGELEIKSCGRDVSEWQDQTLRKFLDDCLRYDCSEDTKNVIRKWTYQGQFCIAFDVKR